MFVCFYLSLVVKTTTTETDRSVTQKMAAVGVHESEVDNYSRRNDTKSGDTQSDGLQLEAMCVMFLVHGEQVS